MTDTYDEGSESLEHAGLDDNHGQGDVVREPPSDYEFADDHGGAAAVDEHTEEHSPLPSEIKPTQRSPLLPVAAAVGGVLLLGTVAWWQLGSSSSPQPPNDISSLAIPGPVLTAPSEAPAIAAAPALPIAPKTNTVGGTASADTTAQLAPSLAGTPSSAVTPTPIAQVPMPVINSAPANLTNSSVVPLAPAPNSNAPAAVAQAQADAAVDQRIDTLSAHIDSLQKALDQANTQLGQMTNIMAASGSTPVPDAKALQGRLDKLEQQLADIRHEPPSLSAPTTLPAEMTITENHVAPPVKHKHATTHKIAAHKKAPKKAVSVVAASPTHWILRAASPGQAWVAADATPTDLKQLEVGDTLPGIGKVTAIQNQGDAWVVQGTKGKIQ